jgi:hypothetical protein
MIAMITRNFNRSFKIRSSSVWEVDLEPDQLGAGIG